MRCSFHLTVFGGAGMKCLMKFPWVKLMRSELPQCRGIMNAWMKLASRAAYRRGNAAYCGYSNPVEPGMWSGGIVGLKSILKTNSRAKTLEIMDKLAGLGLIRYELDTKTKKLTYMITDWVTARSDKECSNGPVYATEGYGFICVPRTLTNRLIKNKYIFEEADAWLDLWCHTVFQDQHNAFSFFAPTVQYGLFGTVLTLETLGRRWGWEKTKVWRFFKKHGDVFLLYRLPGNYGCLVFNKLYPCDTEVSCPSHEQALGLYYELRTYADNLSGRDQLNRAVAFYSRALIRARKAAQNRVALSAPIIRAYISQCWNCRNCIYDCGCMYTATVTKADNIRGPCLNAGLNYFREEPKNYVQYDTG